jgi:drug/metabolite transporter (DMT)-like permease
MTKEHAQTGIVAALGSAALFGMSTPAAKALLTTVDPWLTAGLLYLGAGVGLGVTRILQRFIRGTSGETPLRPADLPWLAAAVTAGGVIGPVLLMSGLAETGAATSSLLLNLEGLATMAIAWIVFREHVDHRLLLGALSILAGAVLLSWQGPGGAVNTGALLVALACLAWGIDNNLTRKLASADPLQIAMIKGFVAGLVNVALSLSLGAALPEFADVVATGIVGFLGYGISLALFVIALRHLGTARTGAYFSLAPFVGAVLGIAFLDEPVTWTLVAAGGLMALGLYLHLAERHSHEHVHERIEHEHGHVHDHHHRHAHADGVVTDMQHAHWHRHVPLVHRHPHYPDLHHRHRHRHR